MICRGGSGEKVKVIDKSVVVVVVEALSDWGMLCVCMELTARIKITIMFLGMKR